MNIHFPIIWPPTSNEFFTLALGILLGLLIAYIVVKEPLSKHKLSSTFLIVLAITIVLLFVFWGATSA